MDADNDRETAEKRRQARLEAALRANLKQRKAQQRARATVSDADGAETAQTNPARPD